MVALLSTMFAMSGAGGLLGMLVAEQIAIRRMSGEFRRTRLIQRGIVQGAMIGAGFALLLSGVLFPQLLK
jgi:hypothetical protein